jgi:hypothetical protein
MKQWRWEMKSEDKLSKKNFHTLRQRRKVLMSYIKQYCQASYKVFCIKVTRIIEMMECCTLEVIIAIVT